MTPTSAPLEDQEPVSGNGTKPTQAIKAVRRRATHSARRDLNEKELNSPGVQQMLLDELAQAEEQILELTTFRTAYYSADKEVAVLQAKGKIVVSQEIISFLTGALGGAAFGFLPTVWEKTDGSGALTLAVGVVLLAAGAIAKVVRA
ncbi:hypothetical protein [Variovorax sp. Varisp62]|uniref:hypothetical protein n=1 Tax=Variovorax sp. Varisp62 TaxID=3243049 RepID=UPI0039B42339